MPFIPTDLISFPQCPNFDKTIYAMSQAQRDELNEAFETTHANTVTGGASLKDWLSDMGKVLVTVGRPKIGETPGSGFSVTRPQFQAFSGLDVGIPRSCGGEGMRLAARPETSGGGMMFETYEDRLPKLTRLPTVTLNEHSQGLSDDEFAQAAFVFGFQYVTEAEWAAAHARLQNSQGTAQPST